MIRKSIRQRYIVGESGSEIFTPAKSGVIAPSLPEYEYREGTMKLVWVKVKRTHRGKGKSGVDY